MTLPASEDFVPAFSAVERAVLDFITGMYPELTAAMQTQLANCRVTLRSQYFDSYMVVFEVADGVAPFDTLQDRFGDALASVREFPHPLRFALCAGSYGGQRYLDVLECNVEGNADLDGLDLMALTMRA